MKTSRLTATDMFCGAGGSSLGAHLAGVDVCMAMNHWSLAVETHNTNFPDTWHDCADISAQSPKRYPSTTMLLASPECTNHSKAKGKKRVRQPELLPSGQLDPSAERSRATMWDVPRFAEVHNYEIIIVENVVDVRDWVMWDAWLLAMRLLGYEYKVLYLNSMFFPPTPQSRDRLYVVFWKPGNRPPALDYRPPAICEACGPGHAVQSWKRPNRQYGVYKKQYVYRCPICAEEVQPFYYAAFNAIDWSDLGTRIGDRKRPLKEKTISRVQKGLDLFGQQAILVQLAYSQAKNNRAATIVDPLFTQSTRQSVALVTPAPFLLGYANSAGPARGLDEAMLTQFGSNAHALITPSPFLMDFVHTPRGGREQDMLWSITSANRTQLTTATHALISPPFVVELRNNQSARSLSDPLSTVTAGGTHHALINPAPFIASYYSGGGQLAGLDEPLATISTIDKHALSTPTSDDLALENCFFRMLYPREIQHAMAFPPEYRILGTQREQVKQLGNAVTNPVMQWLVTQAIRTLI